MRICKTNIGILISVFLMLLLIFCTGITTKAFTDNPKPTGDVTNYTSLNVSDAKDEIKSDNESLSRSALKPHIKLLIIPDSRYSNYSYDHPLSSHFHSRYAEFNAYVDQLVQHKRWQFGTKYHNGILIVLSEDGTEDNTFIYTGQGLDNDVNSNLNQLSNNKCSKILSNNQFDLQAGKDPKQYKKQLADEGLQNTVENINDQLNSHYVDETSSSLQLSTSEKIHEHFKKHPIINIILCILVLIVLNVIGSVLGLNYSASYRNRHYNGLSGGNDNGNGNGASI